MSVVRQKPSVYHISFRWSVPCDDQKYDVIIAQVCSRLFDKYIYQLENSRSDEKYERDNYHYQGFGHLRDKRRPQAVKQLAISLNGLVNGIEMSAASTPGIEALKSYCLKAATRIRGPWHDGSVYIGEDLIVRLFPWQEQIKNDITACKADDRAINVLVDDKGNIGKSAFCKYMCWHHKIPVLGWGKTGDILHLVSKMPNRSAYIFDLSRSKPQDWGKDDICAAMEGIKNGLFVNTKYECSQVVMKVPHIWIFTNHIPNISAMSRDRWRFWTIHHNRLRRSYLRESSSSPPPRSTTSQHHSPRWSRGSRISALSGESD